MGVRGQFESVLIVGDNPATTTLVVKAKSGQTANLVEYQTSAGAVVGSVPAAGGVGAVTSGKMVNWANDVPVLSATTPGTDATPVAGTVFVSRVWVPATVSLTGVAVFNGTAVGTDKWIVALYSNAGVVLANSALAGTTAVGTGAVQKVAFTSAYTALGPDYYFLSVSCNGTTARFRAQAIGVGATLSQAGAFGTLDSLSPVPSVFTADVGPVAATY